jgi:hypothetical protein
MQPQPQSHIQVRTWELPYDSAAFSPASKMQESVSNSIAPWTQKKKKVQQLHCHEHQLSDINQSSSDTPAVNKL